MNALGTARASATPSRIAVIATPGLGDVFLATPLVRSLRSAYPGARIDFFARSGTGAVLEHNPDLNAVHEYRSRPPWRSYVDLYRRFGRSYDLAVSTSASDRACAIAAILSKDAVCVVGPHRLKESWKRLVARRTVPKDDSTHIVLMNLRLADALGISRSYESVVPLATGADAKLDAELPFPWREIRYAAVHAAPGSDYKVWPAERWAEVARALNERGLRVVLTGGAGARDVELNRAIAREVPQVIDATGKFSFGELSQLIASAALFVGVDTSTTHIAAATGTPTVVLMGPSNSVKWAPWPKGYARDLPPFETRPGIQHVGNVVMATAACRCWPFNRRCRFSANAFSSCLTALPAALMLEAIDRALKPS